MKGAHFNLGCFVVPKSTLELTACYFKGVANPGEKGVDTPCIVDNQVARLPKYPLIPSGLCSLFVRCRVRYHRRAFVVSNKCDFKVLKSEMRQASLDVYDPGHIQDLRESLAGATGIVRRDPSSPSRLTAYRPVFAHNHNLAAI